MLHRSSPSTLIPGKELSQPRCQRGGELEIARRLNTAGHEITAAATVIGQKARKMAKSVRQLRRSLQRDTKLEPAYERHLVAIEYGSKAVRDAAQMVRIFEDDVSVSLSKEQIVWDPKPSNIYGDVVSQVVDMIRSKARQSGGIDIDYDELSSAPPETLIDRSRMKQVFLNLLTNAIKYNRRRTVTVYRFEDGDRVIIPRKKILIVSRWLKPGTAFSISVVSDGREIFPDEAKLIWAYGYRGREAEKAAAGLGVGMAVCKRIADAAPGLDIELRRPFDPVVFTVIFTAPILNT